MTVEGLSLSLDHHLETPVDRVFVTFNVRAPRQLKFMTPTRNGNRERGLPMGGFSWSRPGTGSINSITLNEREAGKCDLLLSQGQAVRDGFI